MVCSDFLIDGRKEAEGGCTDEGGHLGAGARRQRRARVWREFKERELFF